MRQFHPQRSSRRAFSISKNFVLLEKIKKFKIFNPFNNALRTLSSFRVIVLRRRASSMCDWPSFIVGPIFFIQNFVLYKVLKPWSAEFGWTKFRKRTRTRQLICIFVSLFRRIDSLIQRPETIEYIDINPYNQRSYGIWAALGLY